MILHPPVSPRSSSLQKFFQNNSTEKTHKIDLHQSFSISRKSLDLIRLYLFIYSIFAFCLTLFQCGCYQSLFTVPYFFFLAQTVYFGAVLLQSFKDHKFIAQKGDYKAIGILYELVFSFSLCNFLYFWLPLIFKDIRWTDTIMYNKTWLIASAMNLIVIWIEQLFSMMPFHTKDAYFVVGSIAVNFVISYGSTLITGKAPYMSFSLKETPIVKIALLIAPICHFVIGNKHFHFKKLEKGKRRKRLSDALINFKAVKERLN